MPADTTVRRLESDPWRIAAGGARMPRGCGLVKHEPWKESSPLRDRMAWPTEAVALGCSFAAAVGSRVREAFCREEEGCYFKKWCSPLPGALSLDQIVFFSAPAPVSFPHFAPPNLAIPGSCRGPEVMERMGQKP